MSGKKIQVKPGRAASAVGFAAGIVFVLIGLTVVVPSFGLFGLFWTAVAVVITVQSYLNAFTEKGVPTHEVIIEDTGETAADPEGGDLESKLRQLQSLRDQDLITEEEYRRKREDLLSRF